MKWLESLINNFDNLEREEIKKILCVKLEKYKVIQEDNRQFYAKARQLHTNMLLNEKNILGKDKVNG